MQQKVTVSFENAHGGAVLVGLGVVSGQQLIEKTELAYSSFDPPPACRYKILDLRHVDRIDITAEQMRHLADLDRRAAGAAPGIRVAIVASHDLTVGLSRIFSAYVQSPKLEARIFPTLEEARTWAREEREPGSLGARAENY